MKVVASWSGGKDSCYAYYLATQQGYEVVNILTMMMSETKSNFHMIPSGILDAQSDAIGIPLVKQVAAHETYRERLQTCTAKSEGKGR